MVPRPGSARWRWAQGLPGFAGLLRRKISRARKRNFTLVSGRGPKPGLSFPTSRHSVAAPSFRTPSEESLRSVTAHSSEAESFLGSSSRSGKVAARPV